MVFMVIRRFIRMAYVFTMNGWGFGSVMLKIKDDGQAVEEVWTSGLFDLEHGGAVLIDENLFGTDIRRRVFLVLI